MVAAVRCERWLVGWWVGCTWKFEYSRQTTVSSTTTFVLSHFWMRQFRHSTLLRVARCNRPTMMLVSHITILQYPNITTSSVSSAVPVVSRSASVCEVLWLSVLIQV